MDLIEARDSRPGAARTVPATHPAGAAQAALIGDTLPPMSAIGDMPDARAAPDTPFDVVFDALRDHTVKLAALNAVLLFLLVEVHRKTDANISRELAKIPQGLDPDGQLSKEVQAMIETYQKFLKAAPQ